MRIDRLIEPEPTSPADIPTEPWEATPGVEGFLLGFFFIGIFLAFLMWAMNRSLRRIKHNAQTEDRSAARNTEDSAVKNAAKDSSAPDATKEQDSDSVASSPSGTGNGTESPTG